MRMRLSKLVISLSLLLIIIFALLGWRCFYLQYLKRDFYEAKLTKQEQLSIEQRAQRGVIVDSRGRYLAVSRPVEFVFADPVAIGEYLDYKDVAARLQDIIDVAGHEICKKLNDKSKSHFVKLKEGITPDQREKILAARIYGIGVHTDWQRYYPMGSLFSHVVGVEASKKKWCEGLERWYYDLLEGVSGRNTYIVDTFRKPIGLGDSSSSAVMGTSLILTLDSAIQRFVRDALVKRCKEFQAESGMAIVIEPNTGAILAMSCYPDFDPMHLTSNPDSRRNRLLTDPFEPGSIFKPIFTAIAMELGVVSKRTKIYCEHGSYHGKGFGLIREYGNHSYGNLTPSEIIVHSSNIGMAKMGQMVDKKVGKKKMYESIKLFGFGEKTGVDLPGEVRGILNPPSRWNGYSVTRIPYGQEISVTEMQIAKAYCILANGGRPVIPHLVKAFVDSSGRSVKLQTNPISAGYIIKPEIAKWIVSKAMADVVKEGTGKRAALKDYEVFGKTGTANIAVDGHYDQKSYVASFAGGAPADNPEIVVVVSIRKPKRSLGKGYTGGTVAAPVVGEIIQKSLDYLHRNQTTQPLEDLD